MMLNRDHQKDIQTVEDWRVWLCHMLKHSVSTTFAQN
jgi:hypothetical protein